MPTELTPENRAKVAEVLTIAADAFEKCRAKLLELREMVTTGATIEELRDRARVMDKLFADLEEATTNLPDISGWTG